MLKKSFVNYTPLALLMLGIIWSCNTKNGSIVTYDKMIDSANRIYDGGHELAAIKYLDTAIIDIKKLSFHQKESFYTIHYNYYFHNQKENLQALKYADDLLELSKTAGSNEDKVEVYSKACFYKGDALFRQNKFNEAYFFYYQGKIASNRSKRFKDCMLSDYSYRMGMILYKQEHYAAAADNFKRSFAESKDCGSNFRVFYRRQELLNNTGISYDRINELDSALLYMDKALAFINASSAHFELSDSLLDVARGVIYGNQASVHIKKENYEKAKALLKKSIATNTQKGFDNNDALTAELKLVRLYQIQGHTDSMLTMLQQIKPQLLAQNNAEAEADWNHYMANYFERKGQLSLAIRYLKTYDSVQTIATKKILNLKANDVTEQLKTFEKDYEVNELKKNNHQKNVYLAVAVVFFGMAMVILMLIYLNWQRSKKLFNTLSELNEQIKNKNIDLEGALNKLEISHQEKDRILRTVAHDLRNPIGGISSLTGSVIEDEECTAEHKVCLKLVKDTANNALELINEIMEATNTVTDRLNLQPVDINDLVKNSVDLLRFKAAEKNQQIQLTPLDKPLNLLISREKIWRVVSNLISNAIKFSSVGGIINVQLASKGNCVEIAVIDQGIGIPDQLKDSVFNMFTEAKRPGTLGERSFGLGLSICRQIVDQHQGKLWFDSNDRKGTTFYIELSGMFDASATQQMTAV